MYKKTVLRKDCKVLMNENRYDWLRFVFVYQKSFKKIFKTIFLSSKYLSNLGSCCEFKIRLFCSQQKGCEMFVSGKQKRFPVKNSSGFFAFSKIAYFERGFADVFFYDQHGSMNP